MAIVTVKGKGFYIWQVWNCFGGDINAIVAAAKELKLGHVLIKIADGAGTYNGNVRPLIQALQAAGIEVWGWQYIYGYRPLSESETAWKRIQELGVTGFVVNAEVQFKAPGMAQVAEQYMIDLRGKVGNDFPLALSTYRYPTYHREFPFEKFLKYCDYNMPQVYWLLAYNPVQQLERCMNEYAEFEYELPMIPTGPAWRMGDWTPRPQDLHDFMQAAQFNGMQAANFWDWQHAQNIPAVWGAIRDYEWPVEAGEDEEMTEILDKLNQLLANQEAILENQGIIIAALDDVAPPAPPPVEPPPAEPPSTIGYVRVTADPRANARFSKAANANGLPIMEIYPSDSSPVSERIQFTAGMSLTVIRERVRADGGVMLYELTAHQGRNGEALFVRDQDCIKTW